MIAASSLLVVAVLAAVIVGASIAGGRRAGATLWSAIGVLAVLLAVLTFALRDVTAKVPPVKYGQQTLRQECRPWDIANGPRPQERPECANQRDPGDSPPGFDWSQSA